MKQEPRQSGLPRGRTRGLYSRSVLTRLFPLLLVVFLAACASDKGHGPAISAPTASSAADSGAVGGYVGGTVAMECAPFARSISGVNLRGTAADWWREAEGRYIKTATPAVGSVLAFRRTERLPDGHVAVVSRVISDRKILVSQANWVHHRVTEDMPVIDVSEANDWTQVRVWWPPISQMGSRIYPTFGFIAPERPVPREMLAATLQDVVRTASN